MKFFSTFIFFIITILSSSVVYSFELNLDIEERLRLESDYLLKDLMIGDTMRVNKYDFCAIKNKLYILDSAGLEEKSKYRTEVIVEKIPGNKVKVLIIDKPSEDSLEDLMVYLYDCKESEEFKNNFNLLEVETINGFTNERDYIDHLIDLGYKN